MRIAADSGIGMTGSQEFALVFMMFKENLLRLIDNLCNTDLHRRSDNTRSLSIQSCPARLEFQRAIRASVQLFAPDHGAFSAAETATIAASDF